MNKYRVLFHGKNFQIENEGKLIKRGFFTTRFIEAKNKKEAGQNAIRMAWKELQTSPDNSKDPATIEVEEIDELESFGDIPVPGKGFTFYIVDEKAPNKKQRRKK